MGCCQSQSAPPDSPEKLAAETHCKRRHTTAPLLCNCTRVLFLFALCTKLVRGGELFGAVYSQRGRSLRAAGALPKAQQLAAPRAQTPFVAFFSAVCCTEVNCTAGQHASQASSARRMAASTRTSSRWRCSRRSSAATCSRTACLRSSTRRRTTSSTLASLCARSRCSTPTRRSTRRLAVRRRFTCVLGRVLGGCSRVAKGTSLLCGAS